MKLLKENEEGFGLIIENSGYVSIDLSNSEILKEYTELGLSKHTVFMNCILQKSDEQNRNGRFYPKEILVREDKKYQELIKDGSGLGESDHPEYTYISLKRDSVAHRVVKTWWEGNTLHGVLEILTSRAYHEMGGLFCEADMIANLLSKGVKIGISSRGIGSLKNIGGRNTVQSDFELICYDLVSTPSTRGAYLYPYTETKLQENENISKTNELIISDLEKKLNFFLK